MRPTRSPRGASKVGGGGGADLGVEREADAQLLLEGRVGVVQEGGLEVRRDVRPVRQDVVVVWWMSFFAVYLSQQVTLASRSITAVLVSGSSWYDCNVFEEMSTRHRKQYI